MKAGIYLGKEDVEIRKLPMPEVGDNDVLVQNLYSSICGTDVAVFTHGPNTGHKVTVGGEFGHETISRVVKVGKNVKDFQVGERVYPYPRYAKDDTKRAGTIGGFSEYILIPNAKRNHSLYAVDARISDKLASLIEPFTVGCRAARRGMIPDANGSKRYIAGQNAVVFGCGTIGIAAAVAFRHFGMDKVMGRKRNRILAMRMRCRERRQILTAGWMLPVQRVFWTISCVWARLKAGLYLWQSTISHDR